jgi:CRP/FNR family transcriptional regulator, cyclic AMP receptor protein
MSDAGTFAWLGHAGIVLLIAAVLVPRENQRALLLALAAADGVAASIFLLDRPSYALLFALVIVAILLKAALRAYNRVNVRFSADETTLRERHFPTLPLDLARRLFDEGHWISGRKGDVLIEEAQAAPCLFYLASGVATVSRSGTDVGRCGSGDLIGEATVMDGGAASGTVRLATSAQLWFIPAARLRAFLDSNSAARDGVQTALVAALRAKLASANARTAESGAA